MLLAEDKHQLKGVVTELVIVKSYKKVIVKNPTWTEISILSVSLMSIEIKVENIFSFFLLLNEIRCIKVFCITGG